MGSGMELTSSREPDHHFELGMLLGHLDNVPALL